MATVTIRNVPESISHLLQEQAVARGMSKNAYILDIISAAATAANPVIVKHLPDIIQYLLRDMIDRDAVLHQRNEDLLLRVIAQNTALLKQITQQLGAPIDP